MEEIRKTKWERDVESDEYSKKKEIEGKWRLEEERDRKDEGRKEGELAEKTTNNGKEGEANKARTRERGRNGKRKR